MGTLNRINVTWTVGIGGTGLSTFYYPAADTDVSALSTMLAAFKPFMPPVVTYNVPSSGDQISDIDGGLVGQWNGSGGTQQTATGATTYVAGTGLYVRWGTGAVINGRRLLGRTFFCPLSTGQFDTAGTILDTTVATLQTAVTTFVGASSSQIFHRPTPGIGNDGTSSVVVTGTVIDRVTSLRSRRS